MQDREMRQPANTRRYVYGRGDFKYGWLTTAFVLISAMCMSEVSVADR